MRLRGGVEEGLRDGSGRHGSRRGAIHSGADHGPVVEQHQLLRETGGVRDPSGLRQFGEQRTAPGARLVADLFDRAAGRLSALAFMNAQPR